MLHMEKLRQGMVGNLFKIPLSDLHKIQGPGSFYSSLSTRLHSQSSPNRQ